MEGTYTDEMGLLTNGEAYSTPHTVEEGRAKAFRRDLSENVAVMASAYMASARCRVVQRAAPPF